MKKVKKNAKVDLTSEITHFNNYCPEKKDGQLLWSERSAKDEIWCPECLKRSIAWLEDGIRYRQKCLKFQLKKLKETNKRLK